MQRGFAHADGIKIAHGEAIAELLEAMKLPEKVAIVKCAGHKTDFSLITYGNNAADTAAILAASIHSQLALLFDTIEEGEDLVADLTSLKAAQEQASVYEKSVWEHRGVAKDSSGVWRSTKEHSVMRQSLGVNHFNSRCIWGCPCYNGGEVIKRIQYAWWSP